MKFDISEKDKKLLVFLSVFVILICFGYWGIYPMAKSIGRLNNDIEDAENEKTLNEFKITQLPLYETENEKLEDDILTAKGDYYPMMTNDEIDKYFTELTLNEYNLLAYNLTIGDSTSTSLSPYQYSQKAIDESEAQERAAILEAEDEASEETDTESEVSTDPDTMDDELLAAEKKEAEASIGIYSVTVNLKLGGSDEQLVKFIDDMSDSSEKQRVTDYSWVGERNAVYDEDGNYSVESSSTLNITIEIYMCEE
jgi:hypothetical protein